MVRKSKVAVMALRNIALVLIAFYGIKKGFDYIYTPLTAKPQKRRIQETNRENRESDDIQDSNPIYSTSNNNNNNNNNNNKGFFPSTH
jgi:hypothetical protein